VQYVGDTKVKQLVADACNAFFGPGDFVIQERVSAFTMACAGVSDVLAVRIGLTPVPASSDNIPINIR
jgi:hypothetical protein